MLKDSSFGETLFPLCSNYTALDIETTGLNPLLDEVIDIAAIRVRDGMDTETFHAFIHPRHKLSPTIPCLTGITNESLAGAPSINEALSDFLQFIGGDWIVVYNAGFVMRFLNESCFRFLHHPFQNACIDIVSLSRILFGDLPNHRMDTLTKACHVPNYGYGTEAFARESYGCYEYMRGYFLKYKNGVFKCTI